MTEHELHSYRITSMEEPTDEMLEAIMLGVQEKARQTTIKAQQELNRRFEEMKKEIAYRKAKNREIKGDNGPTFKQVLEQIHKETHFDHEWTLEEINEEIRAARAHEN